MVYTGEGVSWICSLNLKIAYFYKLYYNVIYSSFIGVSYTIMFIISPSDALRQASVKMRQQRLENRLTQEELAQKSGVPLPTLRKFEQTGLTSLESFFKIAMVLNSLDGIIEAINVKPQYQSLDDLIVKRSAHIPMRVKHRRKTS